MFLERVNAQLCRSETSESQMTLEARGGGPHYSGAQVFAKAFGSPSRNVIAYLCVCVSAAGKGLELGVSDIHGASQGPGSILGVSKSAIFNCFPHLSSNAQATPSVF